MRRQKQRGERLRKSKRRNASLLRKRRCCLDVASNIFGTRSKRQSMALRFIRFRLPISREWCAFRWLDCWNGLRSQSLGPKEKPTEEKSMGHIYQPLGNNLLRASNPNTMMLPLQLACNLPFQRREERT